MTSSESDNTERFERLFHEHVGEIAGYCRWRSALAHDAEDSLAEVFLTAWRRIGDIPADASAARVWLYATARRVTANHLRAARRRKGLLERLFSHSRTGDLRSLQAHDPRAEVVHEALRRLKPADQEALLLAEWQQLASAEMATVMGCSASSARGRVHRARKRFREEFERLDSERREAQDDFAPAPPLASVTPIAASPSLARTTLFGHRPLPLAEEASLDRLQA